MGVYMRNKATGEIRDVTPESTEFKELRKEVTGGGLPMWEQTNEAHAEAVMDRATYGELEEQDLGEEQKQELYEAQRLNAEGVAPEANPHLALTPGEVEAGLTPQQKLDDLEDMFDARVGRTRPVFDRAADTIADERKERDPAQPAKGQTSRAGGSDEREGAPVVKAKDEDESTSKRGSGKSSQKAAEPASSGSPQS